MAAMRAIEDMMPTGGDDISVRTGRALKHQRAVAGFSLRELAARCGISASMISDIERGAKSPTVTTIVRLAEALGVSTSALIDGGKGPVSQLWDPHEFDELLRLMRKFVAAVSGEQSSDA
jgi:transcriptional regulator with XRE-family HTH domain